MADKDFSAGICKEKHNRLNEIIGEHSDRLNKHGVRLDKIERYQSRFEVELRNLIKKIDDLIGILKWFLLALLASGGSFFVWYIKNL